MVINKYWDSLIFGTGLMILSYVIAYLAGWVDLNAINYLEIAAVWTSYICTLLCVYQSSWNYPIGIVTTALYSYLFFLWELPAVAIFNLYLVFSLIYGWHFWGPNDDAPRSKVTTIQGREWYAYPIVAAVIYGLLSVINHYFGYEMKPIDVAVAVLSGVAQFMLDRKKIETWYVWAGVNVLSIFLYFQQELYLVTLQYAYFLGNAALGFWAWKKSMESTPSRADDFEVSLVN